jgi:hypothetical protein
MDNKFVLFLKVGDKYNIPELGEGTVISVLPDHYEIFFRNIKKMKLISKNGKDLSAVNVNKRERTFESDKCVFLTIEIQNNALPKRAKECLDYAGIINHGQLLDLSDEKINDIIKSKPSEIHKYIINAIHKEQNKCRNYLKWLEKQYTNLPKINVYRIPKESRKMFSDRKKFNVEHSIDKDDYFEAPYWEGGEMRLRYVKKSEITYKLIHEIDNLKVKEHFLSMIKLKTIDDCYKYLSTHEKTDYWNSYKAYMILGYLSSDLDEKNFVIKNKLQKVIHNTIRAIRKNTDNYFVNELNCSLFEFRKRFESLFKDGMNWENYRKWEVDHIRPCNSFNLTDANQQKECFCLSNFQPLWKNENMVKSDDGYFPAKSLIKELINKPETVDELFSLLNTKFEKEHPPAFYNYIYNRLV